MCLIETATDNKADTEDMDEKEDGESPKKDYCGDNYINADRFFLVASPVIFLIFNIVYWMSYGSQFYLSEFEMDDDGQSG